MSHSKTHVLTPEVSEPKRRLLPAHLTAIVVIGIGVALAVLGCKPNPSDNDGGGTPGSRYIGEKLERKRVIVFLHGTLGDVDSTWTNPGNKQYWPSMVREDALFDGRPWPEPRDGDSTPRRSYPPANVFVAEYPAEVRSNFSIKEAARTVLLQLEGARDRVLADHDEIVFVCHSMGGLVALELVERHGTDSTFKFADRVKLIYLVATPGSGSNVANLGALLSDNPGWDDMRLVDTGGFLNDLWKRWKDFEFGGDVVCAFEMNPFKGTVVVVPEGSATRFTERGRGCIGIDADHFSIAKPEDRYADQYEVLANAYAALDVPNPPDPEPSIRVSSNADSGAVPFEATMRAEVLEGLAGGSLKWRWSVDGKLLSDDGESVVVEIDRPGPHVVKVEAEDGEGRRAESTTTVEGIEVPASVQTVERMVSKVLTTTDAEAEREGNDDEIDSDDWTWLDVAYETAVVDDGRRVEVKLTWEARELESDRRFEKGNTRFRSAKTFTVWQAESDNESALSVTHGARGSKTFFVKGRCHGLRSYYGVEGLSDLRISFDAKGRNDRAAQALTATLEVGLIVEIR